MFKHCKLEKSGPNPVEQCGCCFVLECFFGAYPPFILTTELCNANRLLEHPPGEFQAHFFTSVVLLPRSCACFDQYLHHFHNSPNLSTMCDCLPAQDGLEAMISTVYTHSTC